MVAKSTYVIVNLLLLHLSIHNIGTCENTHSRSYKAVNLSSGYDDSFIKLEELDLPLQLINK